MKHAFPLWLIVLVTGFTSCKSLRSIDASLKDDKKIEITFVQVNDVYEIAPIAGGAYGGMARVATIKKQYKKDNPNTFLVMAGDFVSPSVYNSLQYQGKRIRGMQMIEAMNAAGMDMAIFGNHEFDISEEELGERINESDFQWIASNTFHLENGITSPFKKVKNNTATDFPRAYVMSCKDADGTSARIGIIGITLPFNKAGYVSYTDPVSTAKKLFDSLKHICDAVVAVTHLRLEEDIRLAKEVPGLALILGGHEHDMRFEKTGNVYITKAHANARSAFVVKLNIDKSSGAVAVTPELKSLDSSVPLDSATNVVVRKWMDIGVDNYASLGFDAGQILIGKGDTLDGRETEVRSRSTNFTRLISAAVADAFPDADVVIYNAGSIRVDDMLMPPVTQYDIIRSLPFGGGMREVEMTGELLLAVLNQGRKNTGNGGFLHYQPVMFDSAKNSWTINNTPVDPQKTYKVALSDFLLTGKEENLQFLNKDNPGILEMDNAETSPGNTKADIRLAIVRYLQKK